MEIRRKDEYTWIVDGEQLTTSQFVAKCCPSKTIAEWCDGGLMMPIIQYTMDYEDSPNYGWQHFFDLNGIQEDPAPLEAWDKKYHALLY